MQSRAGIQRRCRVGVHAHLHGGIPERDVDALQAYWDVMPNLRSALFAPQLHYLLLLLMAKQKMRR